MSDIRLCVRDHEGDYWTDIHGSDGDRLIAACSRTPRTLAELCAACEHYAKGSTAWVEWFRRGRRFQRFDSGLVIIDLTARLIVIDSGYSNPQLVDRVYYHNGSCKTSTAIPYDLTADDWLITKQVREWESLARRRWDHLHGIVHAHPLEQSPRMFAAAQKPDPAPLAE